MTHEQQRFQQAGLYLMAGLLLCGVAFFAPDAGHHPGDFFRLATQTTWLNPLQTQAAWCSFKILLLSIGLLLSLDSVGSVLLRLGFKNLATAAFVSQILSAVFFLSGSFYLVKALL